MKKPEELEGIDTIRTSDRSEAVRKVKEIFGIGIKRDEEMTARERKTIYTVENDASYIVETRRSFIIRFRENEDDNGKLLFVRFEYIDAEEAREILEHKNESLKRENEALKTRIAELEALYSSTSQEMTKEIKKNAKLEKRVAELEAEAERAEAWNTAQQMTIANHSHRGW